MKAFKSLDLLQRIRSGDHAQAAKDELYRRVEEALLGRLRQKIPDRLQSRLDPEDVLNEAFLRALASLETFQAASDNSFYAFVYQIAKNFILDVSERRSAQMIKFAHGDDEKGPRESQIPSPDRRASTEISRQEVVQSLLGHLKDREAEVIRLRMLRGLSFEAIADLWKSTPGAVQRFYSRAFQHLQEVARKQK